jgi:hypothetical protein
MHSKSERSSKRGRSNHRLSADDHSKLKIRRLHNDLHLNESHIMSTTKSWESIFDLISNFLRMVVGSWKLMGKLRTSLSTRRITSRTEDVLGVDLITDFRTGSRRKWKVGELLTAHDGSRSAVWFQESRYCSHSFSLRHHNDFLVFFLYARCVLIPPAYR